MAYNLMNNNVTTLNSTMLIELTTWKLSLYFIAIFLLVLIGACTKGNNEPIPDSPSITVSSVKLNKTSVTLSAGESVELAATISPENATDKTVSWTSSNTGVATVVDGKVTAVAAGTTIITALSNNGYSATCHIAVVSKPDAGGSEGTGEEEW